MIVSRRHANTGYHPGGLGLTCFFLIAGNSHPRFVVVPGQARKSSEDFILQRFPAVEVFLCRVSDGDDWIDADNPSYLATQVLLLRQDECHALL